MDVGRLNQQQQQQKKNDGMKAKICFTWSASILRQYQSGVSFNITCDKLSDGHRSLVCVRASASACLCFTNFSSFFFLCRSTSEREKNKLERKKKEPYSLTHRLCRVIISNSRAKSNDTNIIAVFGQSDALTRVCPLICLCHTHIQIHPKTLEHWIIKLYDGWVQIINDFCASNLFTHWIVVGYVLQVAFSLQPNHKINRIDRKCFATASIRTTREKARESEKERGKDGEKKNQRERKKWS